MFRLVCSCLVVALLAATLGRVDAKAADAVTELILAANTEAAELEIAEPTGATPNEEAGVAADTEADGPDRNTPPAPETEANKIDLPNVEELVREAIRKAFAPADQQRPELADPDRALTEPLPDLSRIWVSDLPDVFERIGLKTSPGIQVGYSETVPIGQVISQEPEPGAQLKASSKVTVVVSHTRIAIEPYRLPTDLGTGTFQWGQTIVHRPYHVRVENPASVDEKSRRHIPMFTVFCDGVDGDKPGNDYERLERRARYISERILTAWDMMDHGAKLEIVAEDGVEEWKMTGPYAPTYPSRSTGSTSPKQVHIHVVPKNDSGHSMRLMTVYPADSQYYGSPLEVDATGNRRRTVSTMSPKEAAEYFAAIIEAHRILFVEMNNDKEQYKDLELLKSSDCGVIRALRDYVVNVMQEKLSIPTLREALNQVSTARDFEWLSHSAPDDWRIRGQGW